MQKGMISVSVMYPQQDNFNWDYYLNTHMPMIHEMFKGVVRSASIEKGLAGGGPDTPAAYAALATMCFDSIEDFQGAFGPNAEKIVADFANYTSEPPVIQLNEVL